MARASARSRIDGPTERAAPTRRARDVRHCGGDVGWRLPVVGLWRHSCNEETRRLAGGTIAVCADRAAYQRRPLRPAVSVARLGFGVIVAPSSFLFDCSRVLTKSASDYSVSPFVLAMLTRFVSIAAPSTCADAATAERL